MLSRLAPALALVATLVVAPFVAPARAAHAPLAAPARAAHAPLAAPARAADTRLAAPVPAADANRASPERAADTPGPIDQLRPGDLIYIALKGQAGGAIRASSDSLASHIGVVAADPSGALTVIHAYGRVKEEPLARYLAKGTGPWSANRRAGQGPAEVAAALAAARGFLGWPYDRQYRVTNRAIYCSELVWRAWRDGVGTEPVALTPMDFASDGAEVWDFWVRFFQGDVPQGEPGIAPGDYLDSPAYEMIHHGLLDARGDAEPPPDPRGDLALRGDRDLPADPPGRRSPAAAE